VQASTGAKGRTFDQTSSAKGQACSSQRDLLTSHNLLHTGGNTDDYSTRVGLGMDRHDRLEIEGANVIADRTTPSSDLELRNPNWRPPDQSSYNAHVHLPFPSQNHLMRSLPSQSTETNRDISSFNVNIERTAISIPELINPTLPNLPQCGLTMPTGPTSSVPTTRINLWEPENLTEFNYILDACEASLSGVYRNDELGKHQNEEHATGLSVYDGVDGVYDDVFNIRDASSKHYETSLQKMVPVAPIPTVREAAGLQCPQGCSGIFRRREEYRRHMKKHNGPFFPCTDPNCSMMFYRQDKLRDHLNKGH